MELFVQMAAALFTLASVLETGRILKGPGKSQTRAHVNF